MRKTSVIVRTGAESVPVARIAIHRFRGGKNPRATKSFDGTLKNAGAPLEFASGWVVDENRILVGDA